MLRFTSCLVLILVAAQADAITLTYDFDSGPGPDFSTFTSFDPGGTGPDSSLWTVDTDGPNVRIAKAADNGSIKSHQFLGAGIKSRFKIDGDFTVTVDFTLHTFPFTSTSPQLNESLLATKTDVSLFEVLRFRRSGDLDKAEVYANPPGTGLGVRGTNLMEGKYRITRSGSTISGLIDSPAGDSFSEIASLTGFSGPMTIQLFAAQGKDSPTSPRSTTALDISFDNLIIEADSILQPVPEPSTYALAAIGLLGIGIVGWRRRTSRTIRRDT